MTSPDAELESTPRTTLRRKRERGGHQRADAYQVLDAGMVAHVGFMADHGPVVLPMAYARHGDVVYLHGAAGNAMLNHLAGGAQVCLNVTLVDGLVFARSAFHHSMNYRSVVLFGAARRVSDPAEVRTAAMALLDHLAPGRSAQARLPTEAEARATLVVKLPITEGSVKVRTGGPIDDPEDLKLAVWAGVLPLATRPGRPIPDQPDPKRKSPTPDYITHHWLTAAVDVHEPALGDG